MLKIGDRSQTDVDEPFAGSDMSIVLEQDNSVVQVVS